MKLYGLIGYPLGHSFSQRYFNTKFTEQGIKAAYNVFPLTKVNHLRTLFEILPELEGVNVTIPYKEQVIPLLDRLFDEAADTLSVNVIKAHRDGSKITLAGYNSDVYGFEQSLRRYLQAFHTGALVLGTGGASKAVAYVLQKIGLQVHVVSRTATGKLLAYNDVNADILKHHQVIVNCTPLGTFPDISDCPPIPYHLLTSQHLLFDLVYNPAQTEFMRRGEMRGAIAINGLEMLQLQAERAWEIWNTSK